LKNVGLSLVMLFTRKIPLVLGTPKLGIILWDLIHGCEPYSALGRKTSYAVRSTVIFLKKIPLFNKKIGKLVFSYSNFD